MARGLPLGQVAERRARRRLPRARAARNTSGRVAIAKPTSPRTRPECRRAPAGRHELGGRRFGAEEAVGWSVGRQMIEPGQGPPRSQPEPRVPLRPDAIDRTVRLTDRAPPPLSTERPAAERALSVSGLFSWERHAVKILRISSAISTSVFFFAKASSLSNRLRA